MSCSFLQLILQLLSQVCFVQDLLGGQLTFSPVVVHSIVGDRSKLPAAVVLIVDVVCHVLQVLHVSSGDQRQRIQNIENAL